jgi:ribonuclease E
MERERYGRGGGGGGGINRYPDVSGRTQPVPPPREDRGRGRSDRPAQAPAARGSNEPWSDVPPELEALLRAQVAQKPAPGRPSPATAATSEPVIDRDGEAVDAAAAVASGSAAPKARATRKPAAAKATTAKSAAKPRATRKPAAAIAGAVGADDSATADAPAKAATKPRATRKPAVKADATPAGEGDAGPASAPKRRTTRKVAAPAEPV